jgi:hypothetical protein
MDEPRGESAAESKSEDPANVIRAQRLGARGGIDLVTTGIGF